LVIFVIVLILVAIFFFGTWLPGYLEMQQKHKEFHQKWNQMR
jgi:hypothetical protein